MNRLSCLVILEALCLALGLDSGSIGRFSK
jgi:hypothetical protein